jgi:fido (protein-threonine AMPylation protein)
MSERSENAFPPWTARGVNRNADYKDIYETIWARLKLSSSDDKILFLLDTRSVHGELFGRFAPEGFEVYAGHYRGEQVESLRRRTASIQYACPYPGAKDVVRFIAPENVAAEISVLNAQIVRMIEMRLEVVPHFFECVSLFRRFCAIHPYLNGNGRIARLMLAVMANMRGISANESWTYHARPYDSFIGFCFDHYRENPHLLTAYLSKWFIDSRDERIETV